MTPPKIDPHVIFQSRKLTGVICKDAYGGFISQLIRLAQACSSYGCFILRATRLSNTCKLFEQGYVAEPLKSSLKKFYGRYGDLIKKYEVPLTNAKWQSVAWSNTMITLYRSDFILIRDIFLFLPNSTFYCHKRGFHRTFATGVTCWHGTLTPPDTWSGPIWDLHMFDLLTPIFFPNLLFFRTMLFEHPSVLSRFCFLLLPMYNCWWTIVPGGTCWVLISFAWRRMLTWKWLRRRPL